MKKLASKLPIQQMIANAISAASEKLAEDESAKSKKVNKLLAFEKKEHGGHIPSIQEEMEEYGHDKTASVITNDYIEKLASTVEFIANNFESIEFPHKGILQKAAEEADSPRGSGKGPGALEQNKPTPGTQQYKKNHPHGEDAAESEAGAPSHPAHEGDGHTQLDNTMGHAPGQASGAVPHARYPEKGPLVAGPTAKHATVNDVYKAAGQNVLAKQANPELEALKGMSRGKLMGHGALGLGLMGAVPGAIGGAAGAEHGHRMSGAAKGALAGGAAGAGVGALGGHMAHNAINKMASPLRQAILRKLAGEDVMKANISADASANPLAGMGQLESFDATKPAPHQAGDHGEGFGNQARKLIASNQAAIDATKGEAKGPVKTLLSEVLDEPALNSGTDSKLEENLQNTGKAGVKIAAARTVLEKVAAEGCTCETIDRECTYCSLKQKVAAATQGKRVSTKTANAMAGYGGGGGASLGGHQPPQMPSSMGGGMSAMAGMGASPDGCTCGGTGECRVCKLKAALAAAKAEAGMSSQMAGGPQASSAGGNPVEKDSGSSGPSGGIY